MTITTKFEPGESFWVLRNNKADKVPIKNIIVNITALDDGEEGVPEVVIHYKGEKSNPYEEDEIFKTKEELLASL